MVWCGCHEILIPLCYPDEVFCRDQKMSESKNFSHPDDRRITQRSQSNTTWRDKINKSWSVEGSGACTHACKFIESVSISWFSSVIERWLGSLLVCGSELKNASTKWQSPWRIGQLNRRIILPCTMTWFALQWWSFAQTLGYFTCAFLSLFHSARHDSRRRSLLMLVLSHSDTHYLNRHMAWCGCHEILIQPCIIVLFSTTSLLISIAPVEGEGEGEFI